MNQCGNGNRELAQAVLEMDFDSLPKYPLSSVKVAVLDTGVDATHPDFAGRVAEAWLVVEDDRGGRCRLRRVAVPENNAAGDHGTGIAGIICDIAPNAIVSDVRILDAVRRQKESHLLAGFRHAVESDARVINMSVACQRESMAELFELCETAYRNNQVVVAAMRNYPLTDNGYPAELSSCIPVDMGALPTPFIWRYRNGHPVEWEARGEKVKSPAPGGGYRLYTGTSFATSTVSGLVALLLGRYPGLRPYEVKSLLKALAKV